MTWFNIRNVSANDKAADIYINGRIGRDYWDDDAVAASDFINTVNALGDLDVINVFLNTPGGSVSDGVAIANFLKRHPATVNMEVLSEASSVGSVILQAGDIRNVPANAIIMIHDPMVPLMDYFNADELRNLADKLDVVRNSILPSYAERNTAQKSEDEIKALMSAETYMTGKEAVELGFADNLLDPLDAVACSDKDKLKAQMTDLAKKSADKLKQSIKEQPPEPINLHEFTLNACNDAGFSHLAVNLVNSFKTPEQVTGAIALATEVQNICVAAEMPEQANDIIAHLGNPSAMIKEAIMQCQAQNESQEITPPEPPKSSGTVI